MTSFSMAKHVPDTLMAELPLEDCIEMLADCARVEATWVLDPNSKLKKVTKDFFEHEWTNTAHDFSLLDATRKAVSRHLAAKMIETSDGMDHILGVETQGSPSTPADKVGLRDLVYGLPGAELVDVHEEAQNMRKTGSTLDMIASKHHLEEFSGKYPPDAESDEPAWTLNFLIHEVENRMAWEYAKWKFPEQLEQLGVTESKGEAGYTVSSSVR